MLFTSRPNHIQLTLKQHGFELCRSTYIQIFFNSKYYGITQSTAGCNLQMQNLGYGGTLNMEELRIRSADYRLYIDFQLRGGWAPLTPSLLKGQLYNVSHMCHLKFSSGHIFF